MVAPIELYKQQYPQLQKYNDYTIAKELYQDLYTDEYSNYNDFEKFFFTDPKSLETERFGKRADLINPPEDQESTSLWEDTIGGFKKGFAGEKTTGYGFLGGVQGLIGDEEDQEYYLQKAREAELAQAQIVPGFQSSKQAYQEEGIAGLTGHLLQNFGVSFPWMAEAAAGAYVGGKIGGLTGGIAVPGIGALPGAFIGGILGATAVLTPKFFGTNILRQDQAHRAGERVGINEFYALGTAPFQAAADSVLYSILPRALKMTSAKAGIGGKMLKGGAIGVPTEAATEVFQQFLERAQAGGLDYATSEEAMKEYAEAGFVGGVLGGVIGGATGPLSIQSKETIEDKFNKTASDILDKDKEGIPDEAAEILKLEEQEQPTTIIPIPTIPEKEEVSAEQIDTLRQEGESDGNQNFNAISGKEIDYDKEKIDPETGEIQEDPNLKAGESSFSVDDFLNKKLQKITEEQGKTAAEEYHDAFKKAYRKNKGISIPKFTDIFDQLEVRKERKKTGQKRFEIDKIKTDQFENQEEGFVVWDNKTDGENSLVYKTEEQAQTELKRREKEFGKILTKEDTEISPRPGEVLYTAKSKEVKEGTKKVGDVKTKGFEGFSWDAAQGKWTDKWEGRRGEEELVPLTPEEKEAAKLTPEGYTEGHIDYDFNLKPSQKKTLFDHRKKTGTRKDKKQYDFTDLQELKRAGIIPNDARFVEKLTKKQRRLLNERRKKDKSFTEDQYNRWYTTDKELIERGVISLPEDIKSYIDTQRKENVEKEAKDFDINFELRPTEDGKFKIVKILKEKGTNNVVQESSYGIFTDEARAGRALRDAQVRVNQRPDLGAGGVSVTLPELEARDRSEKKILSTTTKFISNVIREIAGPTTGIRIATEKTARPVGSIDLEKTEYAFGDVAAWYDRSSDIIYLSLEHMERMAGKSKSPAEFQANLKQLLSHESFHALQNVMDSLKQDGILTKIEQNALDESFPEGTVDQLPEGVKKILGDDIMNVLKRRHVKIDEKTGKPNKDLTKQETLSSREMQAYVFQVWNARNELGLRLPGTGNIIQRAFKKIRNIFAKTRRFLQGKGYNTWESILKAAKEGDIARRAAPKTEAEAEALGEKRAKEIAETEVPTQEIEGKRYITPEGADYTIDLGSKLLPDTAQEYANNEIEETNDSFKILGFIPKKSTLNKIRRVARAMVETKKMEQGTPQREEKNETFLRDLYPEIQSELEQQSEAIDNYDGGKERVKQALRVIMNVAEAKVIGADYNIGDPNTTIKLSNAKKGIEIPQKLQDNYNEFNFENFKDATKIPYKNRNATLPQIIEDATALESFEQIQENQKATRVAEKAMSEREERVAKDLEKVKEVATPRQIADTRKAIQENFRKATDVEIDEEIVRRLKPKRPTLKLPKVDYTISPAVDIIITPPTIEGTGNIQKGKKRILVENILDYLENDTRSKNDGQPLDITNEENFQNFVEQGVAEFEYQMTQPETGMGWYDTDVEEAMALLDEYIPELKEYPVYKELMPFLTGIASAGTPVGGDWKVGIKVIKNYIETGQIPSINPETGKAFTRYPSTRMALEFTNWYVQKNGLENFLTWLDTTTTIKDINALRKESGVYKSIIQPKGRENIIGADMFGPKVGPFMKKINGIQDDVSVLDVWMNRHFNRKAGNLWQRNADGNFRTDKNGKRVASEEARNDQERNIMNRYIQEIAKRVGQNTEDTQAVLWYFEQGLYTKLGVKSEPTSYAEKTREEFKDVPKRGIRKGEEVDTKQVQVSPKEETEIDRSPTGPDVSKEVEERPESSVAFGKDSGVAYSIDRLFNDPAETGIESLMEIDTVNSEISSTVAYYPPKTIAKFQKWLDAHPNLKNQAINWRIKLQDKLYRGKQFIEIIQKEIGKAIPDSLNFYVKEEKYWGKVKDKVNEIKEKYFEPINKILKSAKITIDKIDDFLYARHAISRNKKIREAWNSTDPKVRKKYKHLSKKDSEMGSGMSDEEALSIIAEVDASPKKDSFYEISKIVDQMMDLELNAKLSAGLYSKAQTEEARRDMDHYVPLAGIDYDVDVKNLVGTGIEIVTPTTVKGNRTPGFSIGKEGPASTMRGRTTGAIHILAQARGKVINSIIRSEKNLVAESFFKFTQEYQNLKDSDNNFLFPNAWIVDPKKEDINQYLKDIEEYNNNRILFLKSKKAPGTLFKFMQDGKERQVLIRDDFLARGLKNLGSESGGVVLRAMGNVTRYLAAVNTAFNPEFIIGNATRDLGTAGINLTEESTVSFRNEAFKGWFPSLRAALRIERGKKVTGGKTFQMPGMDGSIREYTYDELYNEFKANGGRVGFFQALQGIDSQVIDMLDDMGDISNPKKLLKFIRNNKLLNFIENMNAAVENGIRISAYRAARMNGVSIDKSISLAKNLTVNFNRKGEWGSAINAFYIFYNASIQGSVRIAQAAYRSPKVRKMLYGIVGFGFFQDILNRALAGEDDDGRNRYDKINSYTKSHSMIMWIPGTEKFISIPIPYGYNAFYTAGQSLAASLPEGVGANKRQVPIGESAKNVVKTVTDVFNPIGGANSILEFTLPTIAKPYLQLQNNEDYAGRNIYPPDNPFAGNAGPPKSQSYWSATSLSVGAANMLNSLTGGNKVEKGLIDVHPESIDFMVKQAFGGMGDTALKTGSLVGTFFSGKWSELTPNQIPIFRKFLKAPPEFIDKQYYFDLRDELSIAKDLIEYYREEGDRESLIEVRKERKGILRLESRIKHIESRRRTIRKAITRIEENKKLSDSEKEERIKKFKEKENEILARFIKQADEILG